MFSRASVILFTGGGSIQGAHPQDGVPPTSGWDAPPPPPAPHQRMHPTEILKLID